MSKKLNIPSKQRALVLQGGGALGAYQAGAVQALYKHLPANENKQGGLFDIVAGTSSGAMNGAILVSHVAQNGSWQVSIEKLNAFWDHVSTDPDLRYWFPYIPDKKSWISYWDMQQGMYPNSASGELARRYYSAKNFLCSGVPRVYMPKFSTLCLPLNGFPILDDRFFDNFGLLNNMWLLYSNQPLKESLEKYTKFPIATSFDKNQPRLLLVSVDVLQGAVVTFDSYPKDEQGIKRQSGFGNLDSQKNNNRKQHYKYIISYDNGIISDYAIASGSVPINYAYTKIDDVKINNLDKQGNIKFEKAPRYFWDGGILSNTPLRELIQSHKDYWFGVVGNEEDDAVVPDLDVYIVDVWATIEKSVPIDHDAVLDRKEDLLLNDKTDYDEKTANIVSDYVALVKKFIDLAKKHKIEKEEINKILSETTPRSRHRNGDERQYKNLMNGRFDVNVIRIERKQNVELDISNKMLDYSADTIRQLMQDGYDDTMNSQAIQQ
ncbi:MAG: patatin-like phospholipase family protein [Nitrososphaeraceae archaeon]